MCYLCLSYYIYRVFHFTHVIKVAVIIFQILQLHIQADSNVIEKLPQAPFFASRPKVS